MSVLRQLVLERAKRTAKIQPLVHGEAEHEGFPNPRNATRPGAAASRKLPQKPSVQATKTRVAKPRAGNIDDMRDCKHNKPLLKAQPSSRSDVALESACLDDDLESAYCNLNDGDSVRKHNGETPSVSSRASPAKQQLFHAPGSIPKYLQKFKKDREDARMRKEIESKRIKVPDGFRMVGEEERMETLSWLQRQMIDVEDMLGKLPIRIEITAQKNRERKLVEQREKLEEGIKMFSKNLVFVPLDAPSLIGQLGTSDTSPLDHELDADLESYADVADSVPGANATHDRLFGGYNEKPVLKHPQYYKMQEDSNPIVHRERTAADEGAASLLNNNNFLNRDLSDSNLPGQDVSPREGMAVRNHYARHGNNANRSYTSHNIITNEDHTFLANPVLAKNKDVANNIPSTKFGNNKVLSYNSNLPHQSDHQSSVNPGSPTIFSTRVSPSMRALHGYSPSSIGYNIVSGSNSPQHQNNHRIQTRNAMSNHAQRKNLHPYHEPAQQLHPNVLPLSPTHRMNQMNNASGAAGDMMKSRNNYAASGTENEDPPRIPPGGHSSLSLAWD